MFDSPPLIRDLFHPLCEVCMGFQVECVNGLELDIMLGPFSVDLRILPGC